jgi:hypothetical protein
MYLKPKNSQIILRDPRSFAILPPEGGNVPNTSFWIRRLQDGDALRTTAEEVARAKTSPPKLPPPPDTKSAEICDDETPVPKAEESAEAKPRRTKKDK